MTKYANDSSLLVPEKYYDDLSEELQNVLKWAEHNKCWSIWPHIKKLCFLGQMPELFYFHRNCLTLKESRATLLDVWLQMNTGTRKHVDYIVYNGHEEAC